MVVDERGRDVLLDLQCALRGRLSWRPLLFRRVMPTYRFQIDQTVFLTPSPILNIPGGAYIVTKKLPERNGEFEYQVKSINEPYERVVRESELSEVP